MSCQSLAARAFAEPDKECGAFHRSVRFSSESRSSTRNTPSTNDADSKRENSGSMSLTLATPMASCSMTQSAPTASQTFDLMDSPAPEAACRFPKLEECAHFHYERVCLGGLCVSAQADAQADTPAREGWVCLRVRTHVSSPPAATAGLPGGAASAGGAGGWREAADVREWTLTRSREHFLQLDDMLHRCIYDRKVSNLPNLSEELTTELTVNPGQYLRLLAHYVHHFSIIADDSINCGPVLNWLQMDNRGHKLLVANEDTNSINTPAVAAGYCVRQYVSQARDEISFEVGDMISIIDMPGPAESVWWRGKRGFRVGFFPHHCVAVIGDKVPRHMTQPPPIVGSVMVSPIKPVLRKHGKLISLFRSFILSRPSRRSLKQQGILRERVFGCDLGEHLLNCGHSVPQILVECAQALESSGAPDGIYRLSGGAGLTARLRGAFDAGRAPDLSAPAVRNDPHAVASLLKTYFRELPNPLCTYQLYDSFVSAVQLQTEAERLRAVREACVKLPPPHYRTLAYLMRHLRRVSLLHEATGMTPRNVAIVWAPNLLRCPRAQPALQGVSVQAVVTEFLICYAEALFSSSQEPPEPAAAQPVSDRPDPPRPKSLPINPPTKLLSLEEARRRGKSVSSHCPEPALSGPSGPSGVSGAAGPSLKPEGHLKPKYIEVGSGPNNLPQYHTVLDLPASGGKRGLKRSPSGWRGLFTRSKQRAPEPEPPVQAEVLDDAPPSGLRPVKSCESLTSESDTLAPLRERAAPALKHHTRSSSCDSYFEPWQAEIAHMRLRLSSQERHCRMGDDAQATSLSSSPPESESCSAEPSPRRELRVDIEAANDAADRKRNLLEEQLASIGFIDGDSPRAKPIAAEKRCSAPAHSPRVDDAVKRLCTDRDSPMASLTDFSVPETVKLRERNSPRKTKNSARYSGMHHPVLLDSADMKSQTNSREVKSLANSRLSWHGKDQHSTLIKIDWPLENSSVSNLTTSTINSTPITPATPNYDPLESDSEFSEVNKHTIRIKTANCNNCEREKCLKCELKGTDFERKSNEFADSLEPSSGNSTDVSYHNLNRLSAVSNSSNSEQNSDRKKDTSDTKIMTSSHESSSSFSNASLPKNSDELYECYNFARPNYINLQSSSTSKSSPSSPLKSPLKSTISITFRSPVKVKSPDYEFIDNVTPTNERDSVYEDIDLQKNLSIVEDACIPQTDASLPTQQACQPNDFDQDLIILETPTEKSDCENIDVYSQVKFFKKSIDEVNAMILESPEKEPAYENVDFPEPTPEYENINVDTLKICDKDLEISEPNIGRDEVHENGAIERDNGNIIKTLNVRELANRFESPTEQKGPFTFEKFKAEIKYPSLERKEEKPVEINKDAEPSSTSPKTYRLSKNSNARSLDENAFVKEFGNEKTYVDRRKSLEVRDGKKQSKFSPDLNLNLEEPVKLDEKPSITPTTENKISLIQRFNEKPELKNIIGFDTEKKLSRERIEKYKEERRNFLREKYSSQSFRSNPEQLTRIKIKKEPVEKECDRLKDDLPKFERRNTVDLGQRMRFSLARSANNLDTIPSPTSPVKEGRVEACTRRERKEKMSPTYNIRDMAAMFEQQSHNSG